MNRDALHFARTEYESMTDLLADLLATAEHLGEVDAGALLLTRSDVEFFQRRLVALARGALDHTNATTPPKIAGAPRHLRAVRSS